MTDVAQPVSRRTQRLFETIQLLMRFFTESPYWSRAGDPAICDFVAGDPHEMPLPGLVEAIQRWSVPRNPSWFAYPESKPKSQAVVAESLRRQRGLPFEAEDIALTNGAFAGLSVALGAVVDPGDEVIFISPPWFFYEMLIAASGATPVRVRVQPETYDLDLDAIASAITARTRAIIVNTPNNPTGRIYPPEALEELAARLAEASERNGRAIYLISDEAYSRIIYDDRPFHSPTAYYANTLLVYTYGKTLLAPGQRIGYVALPPAMPARSELRNALWISQFATGYAFPNAVMQYALGDLDQLSIDIPHLQRKRDRLVSALRGMGYELHVPEGTFYLLPRSPWPDDVAFVARLAESDIFCLPGAIVEMPGYFRVSLTASDDMIERALPGFALALGAVPREAARHSSP